MTQLELAFSPGEVMAGICYRHQCTVQYRTPICDGLRVVGQVCFAKRFLVK